MVVTCSITWGTRFICPVDKRSHVPVWQLNPYSTDWSTNVGKFNVIPQIQGTVKNSPIFFFVQTLCQKLLWVNPTALVRGCPEMTSLFYGGRGVSPKVTILNKSDYITLHKGVIRGWGGVSQKVTKSDRGEGGCQPYLVRPKWRHFWTAPNWHTIDWTFSNNHSILLGIAL